MPGLLNKIIVDRLKKNQERKNLFLTAAVAAMEVLKEKFNFSQEELQEFMSAFTEKIKIKLTEEEK